MNSAEFNGSRRPIVLDLFCGAGGMSLGFEWAGYEIGLGLEKELLPHLTHFQNFGGRSVQVEVESIEDPRSFLAGRGLAQVDVIIGGPPCQGFSRVGRGKIRSLQSDPMTFEDPRNRFYLQFVRYVEALAPIYFVMENVPDMQYYFDGDELLLTKAMRRFEDAGYQVVWAILQADHYGVPQTRKRLVMVGNRLSHTFTWPPKAHVDAAVTVWQAIGDLPIVTHGHRRDEMPYEPRCSISAYQQLVREGAGDCLYNHQTRWHNDQDLEAFSILREGGKYVDLPPQYRRYRDDIFKDKYWKLYRDRPSWTVEAHIGKDTYRHIYPSRDGEPEPPRTISVREAARLQSFPDRFRFMGPFTKQFEQLGNAVPPLLARAVAEEIRPGVLQGLYGATLTTTPPLAPTRVGQAAA